MACHIASNLHWGPEAAYDGVDDDPFDAANIVAAGGAVVKHLQGNMAGCQEEPLLDALRKIEWRKITRKNLGGGAGEYGGCPTRMQMMRGPTCMPCGEKSGAHLGHCLLAF